jgi:integrase
MQKSPFLESVVSFMRARNYSKRTIETYCYWIKQFIVYCGKKHPEQLGASDVERYLTWLAVKRDVSPGTQALALNALAFLYKRFLGHAIELPEGFARATRQRKLPVVLTREEVSRLLSKLTGRPYLMAALLYGSGLRRIELVRLRVKDIDLDYKQVRVMFGKGGKHRVVTLGESLLTGLQHHTVMTRVRGSRSGSPKV